MAKAKSKKITLEKALVPLEEQPYEVPENWCWIKLGVISSIISKGTTPKGGKSAYVDEGIDFLRVENINDDGTICHDDMMHVTEETHTGFLKRSILEENDILVSIAGTLGKTAIVKNDDLPLNTNQAVAFVRLKDNGEVSREYIRYAIDTPVIQNMLLSKTKVTAIPNLTLEIISECLIPFPPLAEQQRIVEQIESLFSKLDEAKEKAQEVIDGYEATPMGWSEAGADAMCQLRCYVKDYGEEKILELVKYRRSHKQEEATGTEGISVRPNRGYLRSLLLHSHDNDRVYIEKLQATIPSIDIRKKLAIRERLGGI